MANEDPEYCKWIRRQPCLVQDDSCNGGVCAHHAGRKGLSQKPHDHTCLPLCHKHHMEWHSASGPFRRWDKAQRKSWSRTWVAAMRDKYERQTGDECADCIAYKSNCV